MVITVFDIYPRLILCCIFLFVFSVLPPVAVAYGGDEILTKEERRWLEEHLDDLVIGIELGFPPFSFMNKGKLDGFTNDYIYLLEEKLGVQFKRGAYTYLHNLLASLKKGEIAFLANIRRNEKRATLFDFSMPYIDVLTVFITKTHQFSKLDFGNAKGLIIAVQQDSANHDFISRNYKHLTLSPQDDTLACLLQVSTGQADAALVNLPAAAYLIEKKGITGLKIEQHGDYSYGLRFAVRKNLPRLTVILDKGIRAVKKGEFEQIYSKWVHLDEGPFYTTARFKYTLAALTCLAGLLLSIILAWNMRLRAAVKKRSEEIRVQQQQLDKEIVRRRKKQNILRERQTRVRTMLETIPDMVWFKNPEGQYLFCNNEFETFYGHSEQVLVGHTDFTFLKQKTAQKSQQTDRQVLKDMKPMVEEQQVIYALNRKTATLEIIKVPVLTPDGEIIGVLGIGRDISEIKRIEIELVKFHRQIETILKNVNGFTYRVRNDVDLTLEFVSGHISELAGKTAAQLMDEPHMVWGQVIYAEDRKLFLENYKKMLHSKRAGEYELRLQHVNGDIFWVMAKSVPVFDSNGDITHIDGIVMDMTKQRRLKEDLAQARDMEATGILAGGIAHDFNNLLAGILGYGELLREDMVDTKCTEDMTRSIEVILAGGRRARDLVAQILTFSRISAKGASIVRTADVMNKIMELLRASLPKSVEIKVEINSDSAIRIESDRLHQLILNLCTDCFSTMTRPAGKLSMTLMDKHCRDVIGPEHSATSDMFQHITIETSELNHISTPFSKNINSSLPAMVEGLLNNAGGFMKKTRFACGEKIEIFIPVYSQLKESAGIPTDRQEQFNGVHHILLVDTERTLTHIMEGVLLDNNCVVKSYTNSAEALAELRASKVKYDLLIASNALPMIVGETLCRHVRGIDPSIRTLLLLESASIEVEDLKMVDAVLRKPFTSDNFILKVRQLCSA